jgi:tripartite-type tricarboxylate transporter receptor subunit TctC
VHDQGHRNCQPHARGRDQDVPTTKEGGLPEFQVSVWNAIFAPKNLPQDIQAKLNDAVVAALDDDATSKRLLQIGCVIPDKNDRTPQALKVCGKRGCSLVVGA